MNQGKKPALGRGLSALLPGEKREETSVREVDISQISANRYQPRSHFDPRRLADLAASIRANGIVQPIVVTPRGDGGFSILAGERRWRAAREAGLSRLPVVVRPQATDAERLELALVENLQREDLNPMEEAAAYGRLREEFRLSQEEIAARVGKDRATIANALRLLRLPSAVREMVRAGALSASHARAVVALASADDQVALAEEIVRRGLSVRQAEGRAAALSRPEGKIRGTKRVDPFTRDAEEKLSRRLRTKVRIRRHRRGGRIEFPFGSEEELINLFELLMGKKS